MNSDHPLNPYMILGVPDFADEEQITSAYRRLARRFHPDVNGGPQAKERMQEINWAYELLNNDLKRAQFDRGFYHRETVSDEQPNTQAGEEASKQRRMPVALYKVWKKIFDHEFRFMRKTKAAVAVGLFFVIAIFGIATLLSNPSLALLIALPAAWLIALLQSQGVAGRSSGLIGTTLGLIFSTLICGSYTLFLSSSEEGSEAFILSGQVIFLFAIPIATIAGSLVGMMGSKD